MRLRRAAAFVIAVVSVTVVIGAQGQSPDEKQIRNLIAAEDTGKAPPMTEDRIFWSGNYVRPFVGKERGEEVVSPTQSANRVPNSQRTKTVVRRIEIAKSGELAYEFSDSELSFELKNGQRVSFPRSVLRVWRKEAGQWKVAASFARPHETNPAK